MVYTRFLQQPDKANSCGPEGQAFLVDRCCEAHASVADWEGLQQWLQDLKVGLDPLCLCNPCYFCTHSILEERQLQHLYSETDT